MNYTEKVGVKIYRKEFAPMNLNEAEEFLKEVNKIYKKIPKKEKTFMQISGYPHYENVCSNILSFYLNPKEEHGFQDLIIKELLKASNTEHYENINLKNISVFREYTTEKGNRIDIVVQNENIVIGIENKITARLYNDLEDYSNTLDKLNKNNIKIVLSVKDETKTTSGTNFINITYKQFFSSLKEKLLQYKEVDNKWYIYLIDFIKNIEGYEVEKTMEVELNEWIKNHEQDINNFYELLKVVKGGMNKKISEYGNLLEEKISSRYKVKYWQDSEVQLGAYILLGGIGANLDALLTIDGWKLGINIWKKTNKRSLYFRSSYPGIMPGRRIKFKIILAQSQNLWDLGFRT